MSKWHHEELEGEAQLSRGLLRIATALVAEAPALVSKHEERPTIRLLLRRLDG